MLPTRSCRVSSSAVTSIGRLVCTSPSVPVPAASTFSTMSALLFGYTNDLIATLLGRHVDEHVGMILGDDAIHREGEWIGVRELIECRQHTVVKILVITLYARDRSHMRRWLPAPANAAIHVVAHLVPSAGGYAAPPNAKFG